MYRSNYLDLLEIFRKNLFINSVLLLPYIFIVRIGTLINPIGFTLKDESNVLQKVIFYNITDPLLQNIIANLLIFVQVLLINFIFIKHRLSREITLFAGLFYILFVTIIDENAYLSNILIANTFIILAFKNILETYKAPHATAYIFNTGFMIGVASLYYSPYFGFLIFGVIALLQLRSFKILEKIQFFIGAAIPYFLLFTYRYWNDIPFVDMNFIKDIFFRWPSLQTDELIVFYVSVLLLLSGIGASIVNYGNFTAKKTIQTQKKIDLVYWMLLFSLISFLIFSSERATHLMSLGFPLALLIGISVSDTKKRVFYELLHIVLLSLIFISQFKLINF